MVGTRHKRRATCAAAMPLLMIPVSYTHLLMREEEVAGVIAHELAHIRNRDTLIMTVTATVAGAISMLANIGFLFGGAQRDRNGSPFGPIGMILMLILSLIHI